MSYLIITFWRMNECWCCARLNRSKWKKQKQKIEKYWERLGRKRYAAQVEASIGIYALRKLSLLLAIVQHSSVGHSPRPSTCAWNKFIFEHLFFMWFKEWIATRVHMRYIGHDSSPLSIHYTIFGHISLGDCIFSITILDDLWNSWKV